MKLALLCVSTAALAAVASAAPAAETKTPTPSTTTPVPSTKTSAPSSSSKDGSSNDDDVGAGTVKPAGSDGGDKTVPKPKSPLSSLKQKTYKNQWHMKPVRVVHARVQSDDPALVDGRFVSSFGNGNLAKGYLSGMDNVNTASVEGALMYVQAEGINVNSRSKEDRCTRKNNMRNIVFYDIATVQTNETIAEYSSAWQNARDTFEYGPMVPMDGGRCTAEGSKGSKEVLPKACLQYNGEKGQPNVGPMIGGSIKDDDVRAPYPSTYWFSFPNTCPTQAWAKKTDQCRASTRKGLCDLGVAPDGVQCTFAYDILGWIPIDDVVGITSIKNKATGKPYSNLTEWCSASTKNNEFVGDSQTGEMSSGLKFWKDPLDSGENSLRAQSVVDLYNQLVAGDFTSTQISPDLVKAFKPLPDISTLRKENPACYETVPICNMQNGCRREGFSQICMPCDSKSADCVVNADYTFPRLSKGMTNEDLVDSDSNSGDSSGDGSGDTSTNEETSIESPNVPQETKAKKKSPTQATSSAVTPAASVLLTLSTLVASFVVMEA